MKIEINAIAKVNNVSIVVISTREEPMPIKPICDAIGVDFEGQRQRIERDEILGSTAFIIKAVAADGKEREMFCIPFKYIFGWLFSIDTSRVNEDARETVKKYKTECYDALFRHFAESKQFLQEKQITLENHLDEMETIRNESKKKLAQLRGYTFEQWQADKLQLKIEFPENASNEKN